MGLRPVWQAAPYTAALASPLATALGALSAREGWYVAVRAFGATGLGEVVPEPAWGTERPEAVAAGLARLGGRAAGQRGATPLTRPAATLSRGEWAGDAGAPLSATEGAEDVGAPLSATERVPVSGGEAMSPGEGLAAVAAWLAASGLRAQSHPALHAGLELALLDALSRALGLSLATLLSDGRPPLPSLPTAALVGALPPEAAARAATRAVAAGHGTVKLKLDGRDDLARATAVRAAVGPGVSLRLDANALWPDVEPAAEALAAYAPLAPEFLEQPVAGLEPLAALQRRVAFPLAPDEALVDEAACDLALALGLRVLVVKPMWRGGLLAARALSARALAAGARVVLSSALDRGVGTAGVLHLAAALPQPGCVGLGTAGLFAEGGALGGLQPRGGRLAVPAGIGLGVPVQDPGLQEVMDRLAEGAR
ncbi:MAG: enolase C-terminal domain-like protein [Candidatus Sericytochromatia bacterium]|nr:enolase C-terminal domain-like protein [Candidatus Sericytochromatia bacterium]